MIKILHTSDTHSRMTEEKALILKSQNADLVFDSGDIIKSGNIDFNIFGEKAWSVYNGVYDVISPGNREYHFLKCGFFCKNRGFEMPLVSCNYVYKYDKHLTVPYVYFNIKGVKVGVLGVSNINIDKSMNCHKIAAQYQKDIFESATETLDKMKCDFIVALTHIGLPKDRILAEKCPKINLILGGHSHDYSTEKVGNTYIVHSGAYGQHYSEIVIDDTLSVWQKDF